MCAEVLNMFKKFLIGVLMAFAVMGGVTTDAYEQLCCRDGYGCASDCDTYDGDYCGRYGCRR